jgi:cytochrome c
MRRTKIVTAALLLTPFLVSAAHADGNAVHGEALFKECAACHKLQAGANEVGPSLHGIFARKAGELGDFRYSPAMKRSGITWTAETLDKYIADPQAFVPANRMPFAGMSDASDRADLIAYLQKATQ